MLRNKLSRMVTADLILTYLRSVIGQSDIRELNPSASPGLTTLLDTVLYKSNEGCLTATVCAADAVLAALLELKLLAKSLLKAILLSDAEENIPSHEDETKRQTVKGSSNSKRHVSNSVKIIIFKEQVENFARLCLEYSKRCIEKMTCDRLAQSANINSQSDNDVSRNDIANINTNLNTNKRLNTNIETCANISPNFFSSQERLDQQYFSSSYFHDDARPKAFQPSDCWESPRLFCPDYIWADEAIQYCINSLSLLAKHKNLYTGEKIDYVSQYYDSTSDKSSSNARMWQSLPPSCVSFANKTFHLILLDLPAKLCQFRAAVESETLTSKRLYLVKCEYRAPFRAFLESLTLLLHSPPRALVEKYINLHQNRKPTKKIPPINNDSVNYEMNGFLHSLYPNDPSSIPSSILGQQRNHVQQTFFKCLQNPYIIKALSMEQCIEKLEVGMSQLLLPFTDLARLLHTKRCRIVAHSNVLELQNVPAMRELIYRLRHALVQNIKSQTNGNNGTNSNNKDGNNDSCYGIRPILVDILGTAPREDSEIDVFDVTIFEGNSAISYNEEDVNDTSNKYVRIRLKKLMYLLQTLVELIKIKESLIFLEKKETDIPSSLVEQCNLFDRELFVAQFYDWSNLVKLQYEHINYDTGNNIPLVNYDTKEGIGAKSRLSAFLLMTREKEIELNLALSSEAALLDMKKQINRIETDVQTRFDILQDFVTDIGLREMNLKIRLKKPSVLLHENNHTDDNVAEMDEQYAIRDDLLRSRVLELKKTSAVGLFGQRLLMAGERLPLG